METQNYSEYFYVLGKQYFTLGNYEAAKEQFLIAANVSDYHDTEIISSLCEVLILLKERKEAVTILLRYFNIPHISLIQPPYPTVSTLQLSIFMSVFSHDKSALEVLSKFPTKLTTFNLHSPSQVMQISHINFTLIKSKAKSDVLRSSECVLTSALDSTNLAFLNMIVHNKLPLEQAISSCNKMIESSQNSLIRDLNKLTLSLMTRNYVDFFQQILMLRQTFPKIESSSFVQFLEALFFYEKRKFTEAQYALSRCVGENTVVYSTSIDFCGDVPIESSEFEEANTDLEKYKLGLKFIQIKKYEKAIRTLKTIQSLRVEGCVASGYAYSLMGEHGLAIECYNEAFELTPSNFEIQISAIQEMILARNLNLADQTLGGIIPIAVTWEVLASLGQLRYAQGKYAESLKAYSAAVDKCGEDNVRITKLMYSNIGHCYRKMGNYDTAIEAFNKGMGHNDNIPLAGIGACFYKMNNLQEASKYFHCSLAIKDDYLIQQFLRLVTSKLSH
ncbi:hypothetical protein EIN_386850 [Entamoeba invadens IP1]|uniref:Uncharacterized protein n=1 Tax=Entamoeba invadens IP1 TaxID=370355 RepID=A0A0A1UDX4_ENTIV|nr:hypothetical protein EIN_386850 [Entamoeba invadens IP1]ELP91991.1 hypothetical protein EIN_386850 [Entamoeba invadens IP1]|eukprot:XP_004258762.1 hypothetical protein EIN_386850 [Entamoeba invadens IP1]